MTISEASQLVLEAGAIGTGGQTLVFDMGEPVKVLDIVKKMIELSGKNIPVRFGELREGEKLHEDLFSGDEDSQVSAIQPLISVAKVEPVSPAEIEMQSPS
jgi:FlaA1/EpsC-like NDP-sugar epimerase